MNSSRAPLRRTPPPRRPHAPPRPKASCLEEPVFDDDGDAPTVVREVPVVPSRPVTLDAQDLEPEEVAPTEPALALAEHPAPHEPDPQLDDRLDIDPPGGDPLPDDEPIDPRVFRSSLRARGALVAFALAVVAAFVAVAVTSRTSAEETSAPRAEGVPLVPSWPPSTEAMR